MATSKPKSPTKPKAASQNTSAPATPEKTAEASPEGTSSGALATEAAQAASRATLHETGKQSDDTKAVPPAGAEPVAQSLIVTARVDGFRRAGRAWSASLQTVSAAEFTAEQIKALLAEPMLDVVVVAD